MKKLISLAMVALLALGANVSAQEEQQAGAATTTSTTSTTAAASTIGGIATTNVVIGAVALGVAAAVIANDDDDGPVCAADEILNNGQCVCPTGQVKFNGVCTTQTLTCTDGTLDGDVCVIPPGTVINGVTTTVTITVPAVLFPQ